MDIERKPAFSPFLRYVEARASRIDDPVARLRYLRRMMALPLLNWSVSTRQVVRWGAPLAAAMVLLAVPWRRAILISEPVRTRMTEPSGVLETFHDQPVQAVWPVDTQNAFEVYSNGLRVERRFETNYAPRKFLAFPRDGKKKPEPRHHPVGIVFHTTESALAPFDSKHNQSLRRFGEGLAQYAKAEKLYHYVVDRFGRVYRVVKETDVANHSGHSAWGDTDYLYVKLNQSYLGIAFEGKSAGNGDDASINDAQIHSAKLLTWMLRDKYKIRPENCITHAQVSVSPQARRIGYHTDWAANFPFASVGLPNNYRLPVANQDAFGFEYDPDYLALAGPDLALSLKQTDARLARTARERGMTPAQYRAELHKGFVRLNEAMRQFAFTKESD
ncbi:MAG: N-acetylmuramoyl-L-alanine amidase [Bryobacteraceae bacterium]